MPEEKDKFITIGEPVAISQKDVYTINVVHIQVPKDLKQIAQAVDALSSAHLNGIEIVALDQRDRLGAKVRGIKLRKRYLGSTTFQPVTVLREEEGRVYSCAIRVNQTANPKLLAEKVSSGVDLATLSKELQANETLAREVDLAIFDTFDNLDLADSNPEVKKLPASFGFKEAA